MRGTDTFNASWIKIYKPNWLQRLFGKRFIFKRSWFAVDFASNGDRTVTATYQMENGKLVITHVEHSDQ